MREMWDQQTLAAAKASAAPLWPLSETDLVDCLRTAHRWETHITALKARLVREAEARGVPAGHGHRNVPSWLRAHLRLDPQPARELALQAAVLGAHPELERAVLDGQIDLRQCVAIAAAIDAIPATLRALDADTSGPDEPGPDEPGPDEPGPDSAMPDASDPAGPAAQMPDAAATAVAARTTLIGMAAQFPAYQLRRLGERILFHVAPDIAEQAEEAALRRQDERAYRTRSFTLSRPVAGVVRVSGTLDLETAAVIDAALQPLCRPNPDDDRTPGQQRADALADVCRLALRSGELPEHGGEPPQLVVTVKYDPLTQALSTGRLDNGERVSPATARRTACDARILPILLGGDGQILDAGRTRRTAHGPLRRALAARDGGCSFPSCDRPPRWCDAHHLTPWTKGGATSLDNLILLCRHHHRLLHEPRHGWQAQLASDQRPEFLPPPWIDPARLPRRNLYHLRS